MKLGSRAPLGLIPSSTHTKNNYAEWKMPYLDEYIVYESIYMLHVYGINKTNLR